MKRYLVFIAACLMGCVGAGETPGDGSEDDLSSADDALAAKVQDVPAFAAAEITVQGETASLYGGLSLQIGPKDAEKYVITAYSRDGTTSLHGQIDLHADLAPTPIGERDIVTRFESAGDYESLGDNRGAFNL